MLHPSTKRLIDKLSEMTRKQRVTWTEGEHATVVHDTEGYRVVITPDPHTVLLTDALGREIETCTPEEFADIVLKANPEALRLYLRLGFVIRAGGGSDTHHRMDWPASPAS
mgnify:CR=1 FL=1